MLAYRAFVLRVTENARFFKHLEIPLAKKTGYIQLCGCVGASMRAYARARVCLFPLLDKKERTSLF